MDSHFLTSLVAENIEGKWWKIHEPFIFYSKNLNKTIYIPKGFVTDFASVPRLPLVYLFTGNTNHWAACFHDQGYRWAMISRNESDNLFYECGQVRNKTRDDQSIFSNIGRDVRNSLMTSAVKALGWLHYKPIPGCLDYRFLKECGNNCKECYRYYGKWEDCYIDGYNDDIAKIHMEY